MIALRLLLVLFNVGVVSFLIYRLLAVAKLPIKRKKKIIIISGGVLLLLAPLGMFAGIFVPTPQYFLIYPVAISLFLYLTRQLLE
jgi:hypothetical protein